MAGGFEGVLAQLQGMQAMQGSASLRSRHTLKTCSLQPLFIGKIRAGKYTDVQQNVCTDVQQNVCVCGSFWDCYGDLDDMDEEEVRARPLARLVNIHVL